LLRLRPGREGGGGLADQLDDVGYRLDARYRAGGLAASRASGAGHQL
jgi:hypothetical protein